LEVGVTAQQKLIYDNFPQNDFNHYWANGHAAPIHADKYGAVIMARAVKSPVMQKHITAATHTAILARLRICQPDFGLEAEPDSASMKALRVRPARKIALRAD
jgi:hypothetical protein